MPGRQLDAWRGPQRLLVLPITLTDGPPPGLDRAELEAAFFGPSESLSAWFTAHSGGATEWSGAVEPWRPAALTSAEALEGCTPRAILSAGWAAHAAHIDPSAFDADGDGKIDHLIVLYAGRHTQERIRARCVMSAFPGVESAATFQAQGVGPYGERVPIGFYLHESAHALLGLRDLYGSYKEGDYGIGVWGLMGLGQWGPSASIPRDELFAAPTGLEPMHRARAGWLEPTRLPAGETALTLLPREAAVITLPASRGGGSLWLESRQDPDLPGRGLLLWRRPPREGKKIRLIQADGRDDLSTGTPQGARPLPPIDQNFGDAGDPFPGSEGVTRWQDEALGVTLDAIKVEDGVVSLTVVVEAIE